MHDLARLAARLYNAPLLVLPETAMTVADAIGERLSARAPLKALEDDDLFPRRSGSDKPYTVANGVATLPVRGELVNRGSFLNSLSGLTSYDSLKGALQQAADDPSVRAVILDMDSPGGEAAGAMETADEVRALSNAKPVIAFVNSMAASAAYAIAAGAKEIVLGPSATVGSIGVVWLHLDRSQALAKAGVKPTLLHAGAYKVDGNSLNELAPEAKARIQSQIDDVYGLFTASVGKHRPSLSPEGARKTEAGLFMGQKALDAKLADRIGDMRTALSAIPRKPHPFALAAKAGGKQMEPIYTQEAYDAGIANAVAAARRDADAAQASALALAVADATKAGAAAERTRIAAIFDSEAAKGKASLARHFALATDMSPEAAATALGAAATEQTGGRMALVPNPDVRGDSTQREQNPKAEVADLWNGVTAKLNAERDRKRAR